MFDRQRFIDDAMAIAEQEIPFRHQGSDPSTGLDCINLARYLYSLQGLRLPEALDREFDAYHDRPDGLRLLRIMREWFYEVSDPEPADLLIFFARRNPQHMAILVKENEVVEAYRGDTVQKVLRQPLDPRRRVAACFRIPDFETA